MWYYGEDAGRMAKTSEVICVDSLLRRATASEVITIAKESYDAVDLLALFIKKVIELPQKLGNTSHVTGIVLTVDHLTKELIGIFRHVAELLVFYFSRQKHICRSLCSSGSTAAGCKSVPHTRYASFFPLYRPDLI